jgi:hypothetical protein
MVVGLPYPYNPESYAGGSVATGRVWLTEAKRDTLVLQVGGWAWG